MTTQPLPVTLTLPGVFARHLGRTDPVRNPATKLEGWLHQAFIHGERLRRGVGYTLRLRLHEANAADIVDLIEHVFEEWIAAERVQRITRISIRQYLQRARDQLAHPETRA